MEVYAITDIHGYSKVMRDAAAQSLSDDYTDNLDEYISLHQMINLVMSECLGFDDENRPLLDEDTNEKIYNSTVLWINNVGLAKLAAEGFIECAWDDTKNEMVFWANKELNSDQKIKAMGKKPNDKRRNKKKNKGS